MALDVKWDPSPVPQPCWPSLQLHKDMERSQFMIYFGTRACLFKVAQFQNQDLNRMLRKLQNIDKAALPKDELREVMDGAPRPLGTCSLAPGVWWGSQSVWGRREAGGRRRGKIRTSSGEGEE